MTKEEFYSQYRNNDNVTLGVLQDLINSEELYENIDLRTGGSYDDYLLDEVRYRLDDGYNSGEIRDYLNAMPYANYNMYYLVCEEDGYAEELEDVRSDINRVLGMIEEELKYKYEDEWENKEEEIETISLGNLTTLVS